MKTAIVIGSLFALTFLFLTLLAADELTSIEKGDDSSSVETDQSETTKPNNFFDSLLAPPTYVLAQSAQSCKVGCQNEGERCWEDCEYQADIAAEDVAQEQIDITDANAILQRTKRLNQIMQEKNRCQTRCNNELHRCGRACDANRY